MNLEKNPHSKVRTNNSLHKTASTGLELGSQRWLASAYPPSICLLIRILIPELFLIDIFIINCRNYRCLSS